MARQFPPIVPPNDPRICEPWLARELRRISAQLGEHSTGLAAVVRGEVPDGSGNPIVDLTHFYYKPGLPGGQIAFSATEAGGDGWFSSTKSTDKGFINFGYPDVVTTIDEDQGYVGVGTETPDARMHLVAAGADPVYDRPSALHSSSGSGWQDSAVSGTFYPYIQETIADDDATYINFQEFGFGGTLTFNLGVNGVNGSNPSDPGAGASYVFRIRARKISGTSGDRGFLLQLANADNSNIFLNGSNTYYSFGFNGTYDYTLTTSYQTFEITLSATEAANIKFNSQPQRFTLSYTGLLNSAGVECFRITWIEFELQGPTIDTLQRWTIGSDEDALDSVQPVGTTGHDLVWSGDMPLLITAGLSSASGVRLWSTATAGRVEFGSIGSLNMAGIISGNQSAKATSVKIAAGNVLIEDVAVASLATPDALLHLVQHSDQIGLHLVGGSGQTANLATIHSQTAGATDLIVNTRAVLSGRIKMDTGAIFTSDATPVSNSKQLEFASGSISTATTRTWTIPNWDGIPVVPSSLGTSSYVLTSAGSSQPTWADPAHNLLSLTHSDTTAASVARGDLITGQGASPKWARLAKGTAGQVLAMDGTATDIVWMTISSANHAILSSVHTDSTPAAVTRGGLITGQGASPTWSLLAVGSNTYVLTSDGTDISWQPPPSATPHDLLDGTVDQDTTAGSVARGDLITGQGATPKWTRLAKGSAGQVLTMDGTGTDVAWVTPSAGGDAHGQATVDFGNGTDQATVTVTDASIGSSDLVIVTMSYDPTGSRDRDELDMDQFECKVGNIVAATSFDIIVTCLTGYAHGTFYVDWEHN